MKILPVVLAFLCSLALARGSESPTEIEPTPNGIEVLHNVEIGKGGDRVLHAEIARPKPPLQMPMPAVIWIHGGGWYKGSHKPIASLFWLAEKGYFIASIEYRLSGEAKWPAQIEDCKLAVRWLRANAKKYNVNPDRIGCWGSSAGGHLVACLGTMGDESQFEGNGGYEGVSSRVQAVVDCWGPTDMRQGSAGIQRAKDDAKDASILVDLFGAPFKENPDIWKQGSPITYVKAGNPPFLIIHGDQDTTVPYEQSERFAAVLEKAQVPVELITVKGAGHGEALRRPKPGKPSPEPSREALLAAIASFFDEHLKK